MEYSTGTIWLIIAGLGAGTFLIRFSFLGLIGDRELPPWLLRHLRYTAVSVLPALIAPAIVWPPATEGQTDPARLVAAAAALALAYWTKSPIAAIIGGMGSLWLLIWVLG